MSAGSTQPIEPLAHARRETLEAFAAVDADPPLLDSLLKANPALLARLDRILTSGLFDDGSNHVDQAHGDDRTPRTRMRIALLLAALWEHLTLDPVPGADTDLLWEPLLRRTAAATLIAEARPECGADLPTNSLAQDIGLLALLRRHSPAPPEGLWSDLVGAAPDERAEMEGSALGTTREQCGADLLRAWEAAYPDHPPTATERSAPDTHEELGDSGMPRPALRCVDWVSAVFEAANKSTTLDSCRQQLLESLGLNADCTDALLARVPERTEAAARGLDLTLPPQATFDQILDEAHVTLIEEILSFQDLTWQLRSALKERDRLASELNQELTLAREIQRTLLPPAIHEKFAVAGVNVPARQLSGDFYDYYSLKDGRIMFCLGDVSGKGTNAAILMAKTCGLFRGLGKHIHDPCQVLTIINEEIYETSTRGMFVTMVAGVYAPLTGEVQIVNAGHLPAILIDSGCHIRAFDAVASPLGVDPGASYTPERFALDEGSLYLFSDGLTEAHVAERELGIEGLIRLFIESAGRAPTQRMQTLISRFDSGSAPRDDLTLLLIEGVSRSVKRPLPMDEHTHDRQLASDQPAFSRLFQA